MIDISVNRLVKSFDLEKKILDGITFQIDTGERVGLLGKNGAGKTTLFRILTGELDYDEGQVMVAPDRRVGLISQIPVYPDGYTVEDVLRSAFERMFRIKNSIGIVVPCVNWKRMRTDILYPMLKIGFVRVDFIETVRCITTFFADKKNP